MRSKLVRVGAWAASLFVAVSLFAAPAAAQDTQKFVIRSFHSDFYLSRDSQNISKLKVTEKIVAEFPSFDQNHGIIRAIPLTYQGHDINLKLEKVVDAGGNKIKYSTDNSDGNMLVKIGDANKYVHGVQEYNITYSMQNVIAKFSDHDELFWDVNGDDWKQPFDSVTASIHIPKDLVGTLKADQRIYRDTNNSTQ